MNKTVLNRIDSIGKSLPHSFAILDEETRPRWARVVAVAYHLGNLKDDEHLFEGLGRALGHEGGWDFMLWRLRDEDRLVEQWQKAERSLFARFGLDVTRRPPLPAEFTQACNKMLEQVPEHWLKPIKTAHTAAELFDLWDEGASARQVRSKKPKEKLKTKLARRILFEIDAWVDGQKAGKW